MAEEVKRSRRVLTKEEKKQALEARIKDYESKIAELKQKIKALDTPVITMKDVCDKIKGSGLTNEEVMKLIDKASKKSN